MCCLLGAVMQDLGEQNPSHCNREQIRGCLMRLNVYKSVGPDGITSQGPE